jgi:hypothetical protein
LLYFRGSVAAPELASGTRSPEALIHFGHSVAKKVVASGRTTVRSLLLLVVCASATSPCLAQTAKPNADISERSKRIIAWAAEAYDVKIVWKGISFPIESGGSKIKGEDVPAEPVDKILPLLERELAKYPPKLVEKSQLNQIFLARNLQNDGIKRGGVALRNKNVFLYDPEWMATNKAYGAAGFHHEFFHRIDYECQRDAKGAFSKPEWDTDWTKLNKPGTRYLNVSKPPANLTSEPTDKLPGFLTRYSTVSPSEERADIFGLMMTNHAFVTKRVKADPVVFAKVKRMRAILEEFCPDMNEKYFDALTSEKDFRYIAPKK